MPLPNTLPVIVRLMAFVLTALLLGAPAQQLAYAAEPAPAPQLPAEIAPQAAALLPEFQGDLADTSAWDRYTIDATLNPDTRTIAGRQSLVYTNRDSVALDAVYLRLFPNLPEFGGRLDVSNVTVDGVPVRSSYERARFALRVPLPQPLEPGAGATIALQFSARTPLNGASRYYGAFNTEGGVMALASFYPLVASVRDGVWQTARPHARGDFVNSVSALYDVILNAPGGWSLVTTGSAIEYRATNGRQVARFVSGPQRDFTIAATRLRVVSTEVDGTRINSYYRAGNTAAGEMALQVAAESLRIFNARFGRYPLTELDIVQFDARKFLGVEYPGLVFIDSRLYTGRDGLEITVAHEVAHQWWYSLVGNDVQREAWLDEALASYSQVIYLEERYGAEAAARELARFRSTYLRARQSGLDGTIARPVTDFRGNYVALVYSKGALFFGALRQQIGDEAFNRFLHDYYASQRYREATGVVLLATAEAACSCELAAFYRDWIETAAVVSLP
ncbi:MAG TPA: M1 family metallopeptidase [Roseiflexaceae bacterium]|nr:M1 family metallopeptidase [Roseiflexaceae bacterium]